MQVMLQETHCEEPTKSKPMAIFCQLPCQIKQMASPSSATSMCHMRTQLHHQPVTNLIFSSQDVPWSISTTRIIWSSLSKNYDCSLHWLSSTSTLTILTSYNNININGMVLTEWASLSSLALVFNSKQPRKFHSRSWNTESDPDLT